MKDLFFIAAARIEHSLREHHALWFFGVGSGMTAGIFFLMVMWQPTVAPFASMLQLGATPALVVGSGEVVRPEEGGDEREEVVRASDNADLQPNTGESEVREETTFFPEVVLIGESSVMASVGSAYTDDGAYAEGVGGEKLPLRIFVNEQRTEEVMIDTSVPAQHTIMYEYKDASGRVSRAIREVLVY
jgi:hypothetical protein